MVGIGLVGLKLEKYIPRELATLIQEPAVRLPL